MIQNFSNCLSQAKSRGDKIVLVSSGAVGLGCIKLNLNERPKDLISLQAAASVGQGYLMALYQEYMNQNSIDILFESMFIIFSEALTTSAAS